MHVNDDVIHSSSLRPTYIRGSCLAFVVDNMPDTEIRPSRIHGNGLHAVRDLSMGETLGWLDGQILDWISYERMRVTHPYDEDSEDLFMEWNALSTDTLLLRPFRTKYGFINHSRSPNLELLHDPLRVVVACTVSVNEELTLDYRREPLRADYLRKATYL